jgi:uncharacterized membrane protein YkoI
MTKTSDKIILGVLVVMFIGMSAAFITAVGPAFGQEDAKRVALEYVSGEVSEIELENDEYGLLVYEVDISTGSGEKEVKIDQQGNVVSIEDEEIDVPITGSALDQASQAALDHMGEGTVTDTEIGDEEGYYEIEVTLDNGREVDVHLDSDFNVLSVEN